MIELGEPTELVFSQLQPLTLGVTGLMVAIVVTANLLIALMCLYGAWRVRRLTRTLAAIADTFTVFEYNTHTVLCGTPEAIAHGRLGIEQLRQGLQQLQPQVRQIQQLTALVGVSQLIWRRFRAASPGRSLKPNR